MNATKITLLDNGRSARFTAPASIRSDRRRMASQAETAVRVLRSLNHAVSGYPVGPFRQLYVFNQEPAQ